MKHILRISFLLVGMALSATPTYDEACKRAANQFVDEWKQWVELRNNLLIQGKRSKQDIEEWKRVEDKWQILDQTVNSLQ